MSPLAQGYLISDKGRVMTSWGDETLISYVVADNTPYMKLDLFGTEIYNGPLWKLVLTAFYENWDKRAIPRYRNGDPFDCSLNNLEWVFLDRRTKHFKRYTIDTSGPIGAWRMDRYHRLPVICHETGIIFDNPMDIADWLKIPRNRIYDVLNGHRKSVHGYTFSYIDD